MINIRRTTRSIQDSTTVRPLTRRELVAVRGGLSALTYDFDAYRDDGWYLDRFRGSVSLKGYIDDGWY